MKIFLFGELNNFNIIKICKVKFISQYTLSGYLEKKDGRDVSYLVKGYGNVDGFLCEVDDNNLWLLDQWKGILVLQRKRVVDDIYSYFLIEETDYLNINNPLFKINTDDFFKRESINSVERADIHLMIPGYFYGSKKESWINAKKQETNNIGVQLQKSIQQSTENEFADPYFKENSRYVIGEVGVLGRNSSICQRGIIMLVVHSKTRLAVVDMFFPSMLLSSHWLLESFRDNSLLITYLNEVLTLNELYQKIEFEMYGDKRSVVFSYDVLEKEKLINLLINEERPMDKIVGKHFTEIAETNIAHYDTAKVYVSEVTLVEQVKNIENNVFNRVRSQSIELFFVEMLLLQDAAVSKLNFTVRKSLEQQRKTIKLKESKEILNHLVTEMTYAVNFTDYKQFYFPTVRISAEEISKAFGLDTITTRYKLNKQLLESMIRKNSEAIEKRENKIKNGLLIIITLLSAMGTVYDVLNLATDNKFISITFYLAAALIGCGVGLYFVLKNISKRRLLKKMSLDNNFYFEND